MDNILKTSKTLIKTLITLCSYSCSKEYIRLCTLLLLWVHLSINPLECKDSYSATSNNMKLVHWPLMGGLLHLAQRGGDWAGPSLLYQMQQPTRQSRPVYNGPLLCGFNVPIKALIEQKKSIVTIFCNCFWLNTLMSFITKTVEKINNVKLKNDKQKNNLKILHLWS